MILGPDIAKLESDNQKVKVNVPDYEDFLVKKFTKTLETAEDPEPEDEAKQLKGEVTRLKKELLEKSFLDKIARGKEQRNLELFKQKMTSAFKEELFEEKERLEGMLAEHQKETLGRIGSLTMSLKSTMEKLEVAEQKLREEIERADVNEAHALVSEGRIEQMIKAQKARGGDKEGSGRFFQPICMICRFELEDSPGKVPKVLACGHTLCEGCVEQIHEGSFIICPFDRKENYLRYGLSQLPRNFHLLEMIDLCASGGF